MSAPTTSESTQDAARAHGCSLQRLVMRQFDGVTLYNADCLDILPELVADAVISDPPYGIAFNSAGRIGRPSSVATAGGTYGREWGDIIGDDKPFDPSPWLHYPAVVLFGANHYASRLPDSGGWLVWDKKRGGTHGRGFKSSDCELAWSNVGGTVAMFCYFWDGFRRDGEVGEHHHPTQKPVALMAWAMEQAKVPVGATVCDPYMGSGSTAIACIRTGRKFIGVEKDKRHFETACERIRCELAQGVLLPHNSKLSDGGGL